MDMNKIYIPFLLGLSLLFHSSPVISQDDSQDFDLKIRQVISFFEFTLNTLGDPRTPTSEKEIIINQSFLKFFKDPEVQVEDDLVENREMVTNKNIQS